MKNSPGEISKVIHDDIHTPKQDLFFTVTVLSVVADGGPNVIKDSY